MNRIVIATLALSFVTAPAVAETAPATVAVPTITGSVVPVKGRMLVAADGSRIGSVYRISDVGPQVILEGRLVTVPADTLAMTGGKLMTSLTRSQVAALK